MTSEEVKVIEDFLKWFKDEGYFVQCNYDEYTIVAVDTNKLIENYNQYKGENK